MKEKLERIGEKYGETIAIIYALVTAEGLGR